MLQQAYVKAFRQIKIKAFEPDPESSGADVSSADSSGIGANDSSQSRSGSDPECTSDSS